MKSIISIISIFAALNSFAATRPVSQRETNFDQLLNAIAKVESNNNTKAIGDEGRAIGAYQIHREYFLDSQRFDKSLRKYTYKNCFDKEVSRKVVIAYLRGYESNAIKRGDWQTLAKTHNGGNNWRKKSKEVQKNLDLYARRVKIVLGK